MLESIIIAYQLVLYLCLGIIAPAALIALAICSENATWWQRFLLVAATPLFLGVGIYLIRGVS